MGDDTMSALSPRQHFLLSKACESINEGLGSFGCYHVGTSADGRQEYRDVDVRFIMEDKQFDKLKKAIGRRGIALMGLTMGQYLFSMTNLPIDFQIQRQTEANLLHGDKYRGALGHANLLAYQGDAYIEKKEN